MDGHLERRMTIENRIMQTAMELFMKFGFKRVSIEEIADKANVSKVTLYKYFTNKHTLVRKCFSEFFHTKADEIKNHIDSNINFHQKLEYLMKSKIELVQSFSGEMMEELSSFDPEFMEELMAIRRKTMIEMSSSIFEEGRKEGFISSKISNESLIVFFDVIGMGIVKSPSFIEYSKRNPEAFDEIQSIAFSCINQS